MITLLTHNSKIMSTKWEENNIRWNTTSYLSKPCKTKQIIIIFECSVIHDFVFYDLGDYLTTRNSCEGEMCAIPCEERSPSCVGYPNGNNTFPGRQLTPFYMTCLLERTLSVGICKYGVYDPTKKYCTTDLDPCKFSYDITMLTTIYTCGPQMRAIIVMLLLCCSTGRINIIFLIHECVGNSHKSMH